MLFMNLILITGHFLFGFKEGAPSGFNLFAKSLVFTIVLVSFLITQIIQGRLAWIPDLGVPVRLNSRPAGSQTGFSRVCGGR